jgi:Undecaprenyl-phosphate galactose phosphotransferase WbaP
MYLPLLPACRSAIRSVLAGRKWWGFPTLVCGNDAAAVKVYDWLANNRRLGLRPIGVISDPEELEIDGDEPWYAGSWSEANEVAKQRGAYWAVVVPPAGAPATFWLDITTHLSTIPHIHLLSELTGLPDYGGPRQHLEGLAGIHLQHNLMLPLPRLTKRLMDVVGALLGGLVLMPLLFYIAVGVKLSSRGPVLYANERIGRDGRRFHMWKFRSMFTHGDAVLEDYLELHPECCDEWHNTHKLRYDPRITRIGRFIRKTSLDELPQLWNVLRGDMSLVGPRPILLEEQVKYGECYSLYTMVSPGITGLWQVSGRNDASYEERLQFVSYYVHNWSLWLDIYLLLRTVRIVLFGKGAY